MQYSVGSVADLISGTSTKNKVKIIKEQIKNTIRSPDSISKTNVPKVIGGKKQFNKQRPKKGRKDNNMTVIKPDRFNKRKFNKLRLKEDDDMVVIKPEDLKSEEELVASDGDDEKKSKPEVKVLDPVEMAEQETRTVFVGNIPVTVTKKKLLQLFRTFGQIQSIRIRGLAPENPMISRRTVAIKKLVHPKRNSMIAYVVFIQREDALKSLTLNGTKLEDNYIRVTELVPQDESKSAGKAIFIGQLDFEAEDNDLWETFQSCGEIESVRIVRNKLGVGVGIGYVNFKSPDGVELALQMEDVLIKKRICRISRCNTKEKKAKANNKFAGKKKKELNNRRQFVKKPKTEKDERNVKKAVYRGRVAKASDKKKFNKGLAQKLKMVSQVAPK